MDKDELKSLVLKTVNGLDTPATKTQIYNIVKESAPKVTFDAVWDALTVLCCELSIINHAATVYYPNK